jgi:hypothetical protein
LAKEKNFYTAETPDGMNIDVRVKGNHLMGEEIHKILTYAQESGGVLGQYQDRQVSIARQYAEQAAETARQIAENNRRLMAIEIATQRNNATQAFATNYLQGLAQYYQMGQDWARSLADAKKSQFDARTSTASGVKDLLKSGILKYQVGV